MPTGETRNKVPSPRFSLGQGEGTVGVWGVNQGTGVLSKENIQIYRGKNTRESDHFTWSIIKGF